MDSNLEKHRRISTMNNMNNITTELRHIRGFISKGIGGRVDNSVQNFVDERTDAILHPQVSVQLRSQVKHRVWELLTWKRGL